MTPAPITFRTINLRLRPSWHLSPVDLQNRTDIIQGIRTKWTTSTPDPWPLPCHSGHLLAVGPFGPTRPARESLNFFNPSLGGGLIRSGQISS